MKPARSLTEPCTISWLLCSSNNSPRLNWAIRLGSPVNSSLGMAGKLGTSWRHERRSLAWELKK
ncbi:hypothetical protein D3C74_479220 [compost metagenome]